MYYHSREALIMVTINFANVLLYICKWCTIFVVYGYMNYKTLLMLLFFYSCSPEIPFLSYTKCFLKSPNSKQMPRLVINKNTVCLIV